MIKNKTVPTLVLQTKEVAEHVTYVCRWPEYCFMDGHVHYPKGSYPEGRGGGGCGPEIKP